MTARSAEQMARDAKETKVCKCGEIIVRGNTPQQAWWKRTYCSKACQVRFTSISYSKSPAALKKEHRLRSEL